MDRTQRVRFVLELRRDFGEPVRKITEPKLVGRLFRTFPWWVRQFADHGWQVLGFIKERERDVDNSLY